MYDDVVIRAEGLSKKYVIGHAAERGRYTALRDVLASGARNTWRNMANLARGRSLVARSTTEEFWALKNVSFEVRRGEVLGIIGRNGAGKSTLLKVLSRITEPSAGRVTIRGRVASLLEVGTGFHPELTGRENIYLNGAILGMTHAEIRRKFDEIVAFAEIEKFLDTPVKRYSSGMYVRLAFAVAAHLEPEILVVDEVLSVGDLAFQQKCTGKMKQVAEGEGRTVLFVSHNVELMRQICTSGCFLKEGHVARTGRISEVADIYLSSIKVLGNGSVPGEIVHEGTGLARIHSWQIVDKDGWPTTSVFNDEPISIRMLVELSTPLCAGFLVLFETLTGQRVLDVRSCNSWETQTVFEGRIAVTADIGRLNLYAGSYLITVGAFDWFCLHEDHDVLRRVICLEVKERARAVRQTGLGFYVVDQQWKVRPEAE